MLLTAVLFAGVFSGWIAVVQFTLRHAGLTALTFLAPLPAAAAGYWLGARFEIDLAPVYAMFAYLLAIVCLLLIFGRMARAVCDGLLPRDAVIIALMSVVTPIAAAASGFALSMLVIVAMSFMAKAGAAVIGLMFVAFGVVVAASWLAQCLPYSERFIANANAARERRQRPIEWLARIVETRWAFSLSGIAIILATIAGFGVSVLQVKALPSGMEIRLAAVVLITFALLALGARNWRLAAAQLLTLAFEAGLGLWAFARGPMPVLGDDVILMSLTIAISAIPLAVLASTAGGYLREGDRADSALLRALEEDGPGVALAGVLATAGCLIVMLSEGTARFQVAVAVASIPGALGVFPAFALAIYTLIPRYRSVEEIFGKR